MSEDFTDAARFMTKECKGYRHALAVLYLNYSSPWQSDQRRVVYELGKNKFDFYEIRAEEAKKAKERMLARKIVLKEGERKVLEFLRSHYDFSIGFKWISEETGLPRDEVRRICRSLKRRELTYFVTGGMTEDGEVAGSGYGITDRATEFIDYNNPTY
jgi:hypothetical protein